MSIWDWLLNPSGLTAHGFCLSWAPGLIWLHAGSDAIIGLAYFSIPMALAAFARGRSDLRYGWVLYLFVAFILACGTTHLMSIVTLWTPVYGVEGLIKLVTAILSIATAAMLWPLIPKLIALPSPVQLEALNARLSTTIVEQEHTAALLRDSEERVRAANIELERRVAEQTSALKAANLQLTEALAQRDRALQDIVSSEAQYRISFELTSVGKMHSDLQTGIILRANAAFAAMLGYEPAEMVGRNCWDFIWPEDSAETQAAFARLKAGEPTANVREERFLRRDGTPMWARVSADIVRLAESGQPDITIAVIEDIDERRRAEAALDVTRRELEDMVAERTQALVQRDLLLREVYHRVKNNLQMVDSFLVMQARRLSDPEGKSALTSLRSRIYALGLVHHQLMGSANLQTFDVAPFLRELTGNILGGGPSSRISLSVNAEPVDVGLDFAIPLGLLVTELVTNALKHAFPGGEGHIDVLLSRNLDGSFALVVADNGTGYSHTGDPKIAAAGGLGNRIITALVNQLKATMNVQSGQGTRFEIHIMAVS